MLRDCFRCEERIQGSAWKRMEECMLGGIDHFRPRAAAKTRFDLIRDMSDEELTKFLLSFRPDVEKKIPNAEKLLSDWLSEVAMGKDFMNCWFFKVNGDVADSARNIASPPSQFRPENNCSLKNKVQLYSHRVVRFSRWLF